MNSFSYPNYRAALKAFGERGIVDLIGVSGYYTLVPLVLNVDRHPLPAGAEPPLKKIRCLPCHAAAGGVTRPLAQLPGRRPGALGGMVPAMRQSMPSTALPSI